MVYPLAKFQVSRPYGFGLHVAFYGGSGIIIIIIIIIIINKNLNNYNRDSALRARTPN